MTAKAEALDLLSAMVLEDGARWGERAAPFQWQCAECLLDPDAPPFRWESRPRGGSKTTDVAGIVLSAMLCQLPAGAKANAYAADRDQARLLVEALSGLVARTPGLPGAVTVNQYDVRTARGATLEVMAADSASAHGRRPHFAVCDELANWPSTPNARALWSVIYSSMVKVPGARLAVITTSGDPVSPWKKVRDSALRSPLWSVAEVPGPLAWIDPAQLEEQRRMLTDSAFARLHLNQWAAAEDRLVNPDDLAAAVVLAGPQPPVSGVRYVISLDLGLKKDRTVAAVCHAEPLDDGRQGRRVVLDRMQVWQGSHGRPVALSDVEGWLEQASRAYSHAQVHADPWQAVGLLQRLKARGVRAEEFVFSAQSVGRVASGLLLALRDRRVSLPDDPDLLDELGRVRLRETSPGVVRLDHGSGEHDDRAVALGIAVAVLEGRPAGRGAAFLEHWGRMAAREASAEHPAPARIVAGNCQHFFDRFGCQHCGAARPAA